jgi:hypothetical protein
VPQGRPEGYAILTKTAMCMAIVVGVLGILGQPAQASTVSGWQFFGYSRPSAVYSVTGAQCTAPGRCLAQITLITAHRVTNNLATTSDAGAAWQLYDRGSAVADSRIACAASWCVALGVQGSDLEIYTSTDSGHHWQGPRAVGTDVSGIDAVDCQRTDCVAIGQASTGLQLLFSTDQARKFTQVDLPNLRSLVSLQCSRSTVCAVAGAASPTGIPDRLDVFSLHPQPSTPELKRYPTFNNYTFLQGAWCDSASECTLLLTKGSTSRILSTSTGGASWTTLYAAPDDEIRWQANGLVCTTSTCVVLSTNVSDPFDTQVLTVLQASSWDQAFNVVYSDPDVSGSGVDLQQSTCVVWGSDGRHAELVVGRT